MTERARAPRLQRLARRFGFSLAVAAMVAAVILVGRGRDGGEAETIHPRPSDDPLVAEGERCKALTVATVADERCRRLWASGFAAAGDALAAKPAPRVIELPRKDEARREAEPRASSPAPGSAGR